MQDAFERELKKFPENTAVRRVYREWLEEFGFRFESALELAIADLIDETLKKVQPKFWTTEDGKNGYVWWGSWLCGKPGIVAAALKASAYSKGNTPHRTIKMARRAFARELSEMMRQEAGVKQSHQTAAR